MDKLEPNNQTKQNTLLFEQYKIAVEMADRISARREGANKLFLSVNSIILVFIATRQELVNIHIFIGVFGVVLSCIWASIIQNYRSLNSAKYAVILEMEEKLPWKIYGDEWKKLKEGEDKKVYAKLTVVEKKLPHIFLVFYVVISIWVVCNLHGKTIIDFISSIFS